MLVEWSLRRCHKPRDHRRPEGSTNVGREDHGDAIKGIPFVVHRRTGEESCSGRLQYRVADSHRIDPALQETETMYSTPRPLLSMNLQHRTFPMLRVSEIRLEACRRSGIAECGGSPAVLADGHVRRQLLRPLHAVGQRGRPERHGDQLVQGRHRLRLKVSMYCRPVAARRMDASFAQIHIRCLHSRRETLIRIENASRGQMSAVDFRSWRKLSA